MGSSRVAVAVRALSNGPSRQRALCVSTEHTRPHDGARDTLHHVRDVVCVSGVRMNAASLPASRSSCCAVPQCQPHTCHRPKRRTCAPAVLQHARRLHYVQHTPPAPHARSVNAGLRSRISQSTPKTASCDTQTASCAPSATPSRPSTPHPLRLPTLRQMRQTAPRHPSALLSGTSVAKTTSAASSLPRTTSIARCQARRL